MIIDIIGLISSHIAVASCTGLVAYRLTKHKYSPEEHVSKVLSESKELTTFEVVTSGMEENEVTMTEEEHLAYLIRLYPVAAKEYLKTVNERQILLRADRYVMRMILAVEAGDMSMTSAKHYLKFSNGDEIWTSNKYYSYGNITESKDNPHCVFSCDYHRLSPYTFMRLVHLEETYFEPVLKLKNKTIKVVL